MRGILRSLLSRIFGRPNTRQFLTSVDPYGVRAALDLISQDIGECKYILNCREAEALGDLLWSFGHGEEAEKVISAHSEYDECGDEHHTCDADCGGDGELFVLSA
ncbi:hypothetical protein OG401_14460 [Kitasatospora purpeofusca]|uniref:hypothetical protein n=1 Tax=Kitasatospora purpeofusca TaxID=67352 RepID=UPI00224D22C7|nr:hypothetical protein [Kitasatospora purpeofusca]MCX4685502.1 hypothetical protein [Kitasatospora purpeofusca]